MLVVDAQRILTSAAADTVTLARSSGGHVRLVNVLPMTPVMLAEYVPPDFDVQQRKSAEEAMAHHRARKRARPRPRIWHGAAGRHLSRGAGGSESDQRRPHRHEFAPPGHAAPISSAPMPAMWCATPNARCWWCATRRAETAGAHPMCVMRVKRTYRGHCRHGRS